MTTQFHTIKAREIEIFYNGLQLVPALASIHISPIHHSSIHMANLHQRPDNNTICVQDLSPFLTLNSSTGVGASSVC